jgi:hypothetical protein
LCSLSTPLSATPCLSRRLDDPASCRRPRTRLSRTFEYCTSKCEGLATKSIASSNLVTGVRAIPGRAEISCNEQFRHSDRRIRAFHEFPRCVLDILRWLLGPNDFVLRIQLQYGIHFADAPITLEDDLALTVRDSLSEDEERWITLGKDAAGRLLVVVYTWRGDRARLISARLATPREKSQ